MSFVNGFSVLAWVKPESSMLAGVSEQSAESITQQLLRDFVCLLSVRWNMELQILTIDGNKYAYGVNTRITASERTITNAIGELSEHIGFIRSLASISAEDLANYRLCRLKWRVPDQVTDSTYGAGGSEPQETSQPYKRKRF